MNKNTAIVRSNVTTNINDSTNVQMATAAAAKLNYYFKAFMPHHYNSIEFKAIKTYQGTGQQLVKDLIENI